MDWELRMNEERRREQENQHRIEEGKREDLKDGHEISQYMEAKREEDKLKKEIEKKGTKKKSTILRF